MVQPKIIKYICRECGQRLDWDEANGLLTFPGNLSTHDCITPHFSIENPTTQDFDALPWLARFDTLLKTSYN